MKRSSVYTSDYAETCFVLYTGRPDNRKVNSDLFRLDSLESQCYHPTLSIGL